MKPAGGTEILCSNLESLVDTSGVNLITSVCDYDRLSQGKPNVLWEHLSYDQPNVQLLQDAEFIKRLDAVVFVSHWQHEHFRRRYPLPGDKCHVIQNAIHPIERHEKPRGKIRLIYTSTPWRGLAPLVEAYKLLNRSDVELVVYSGTSIYGQSFYEQNHKNFEYLYDAIKELGGTHIEYAPNEEVRQALKEAHILAYPNIWEETSCLAAIEALASGCKVVTTSYGALPETCGTWADFVTLDNNDFIQKYATALNRAIDTFWDIQDQLSDQVDYYNKYWSWEYRKAQWERLLANRKLSPSVFNT